MMEDVQRALDAAESGTLVNLGPGEFMGPFRITKSIELRGVGPNTVLVASADGPALVVEAPGVKLSYLSLEGQDARAVVLRADPTHGIALEQVNIVGESEGVPDSALKVGRVFWGRRAASSPSTSMAPIAPVADLPPLRWDATGPFADTVTGILRETLLLGGAVPEVAFSSLDVPAGAEIAGTISVRNLGDASRDVELAVALDGGAPKTERRATPPGGRADHTFQLRAHQPGVTILEASASGIPALAVGLLTQDPAHYPPIPEDSAVLPKAPQEASGMSTEAP